jgi:hypothetical protein
MHKITIFIIALAAAGVLRAGSVNILADPSLKDPKSWKFFGQERLFEDTDDGRAYLLTSTGNGLESRKSLRGDTIIKDGNFCGPYVLTFEAMQQDVVPGRPDHPWSGFQAALHGRKNDKSTSFKNVALKKEGDGFVKYTVQGVLPPDAQELYVEFRFFEASGMVKIRNIALTLTPSTEESKRDTVRTRVVGGREVDLLKTDRHPPRRAALNSSEKDFLLFDGSDDRAVYDLDIPAENDLRTEFAAFGTPGEIGNVFIGFHARRDLGLEKPFLTDLKNENGDIIPAASVEIFRVKNWPQGDGMGRSLNYSIIPELLLPFAPSPVPANTSVNLNFHFAIPENAAPGVYRGEIQFTGGGTVRKTPFALRVLPFRLQRPANDEMCYLVHVGDFGGGREYAEAACREFKRRGIEGIVLACQYGTGMLKVEKNAAGIPVIAAFDKLDMALAGYRAAGMTGPLIIHFSDQLEIAVAKGMGFELPPGHEKGGVTETMKTPAFSDAMQKTLSALKERCRGIDIYVMCIDEPSAFQDRKERALWECAEIAKAGLPASVYIHGAFWKELRETCKIQIFSSTSYADPLRKAGFAEVKKTGVRPFTYGLHGSYDGFSGGMMPSRARSGFMAFLEEAAGQTLWLYSPGHGMDFDGVEQLRFFPRLKYLDKSGQIVSTLQWEGLCAGINDYAYLHTLKLLMAEHTPETDKIRPGYERLLQLLEREIIPGPCEETQIARFTNLTADAARWQIATWIMELK